MNETKAIYAASSYAMLRAMVGIGIVCGLMIVLTYEGTLPRIERLRAEALEQAVFKVIPGIESTRAFSWDNGKFMEIASADHKGSVVYAGYNKVGEFKGIAIQASGQGYADIIRILYGYNPEKQQVIGFYVLESKETPGLGDKIEKDPVFLANFKGLDVTLNDSFLQLLNPIVPVKRGAKTQPWQVDGITGATISSRAIGEILDESARLWVPRIYKCSEDFKLKSNE